MKIKSILDLRPTQFVLGMKEIEFKVGKIRALQPTELKAYCMNHTIPVVLGPRKQVYMIDHHHFARACWETDTQCFRLKVVKDLQSLKENAFWNFMIQKDWVYLHDQFGYGPHFVANLPVDIRCLADDPYRSLAWAVREAGAIRKIDIPFSEFKWAAFFRRNLDMPLHAKSDFKLAIREAIRLAKSKDAKSIPGAL